MVLVYWLSMILTNKYLMWEKLGVIYPLFIILENMEYFSIKLTVLDLWNKGIGIVVQVLCLPNKQIIC